MTAAEIVSNACKQAGLVEDGTTTSIVSTLGIGSLSIGGGITAEAGTIPATAAEIGLAIPPDAVHQFDGEGKRLAMREAAVSA